MDRTLVAESMRQRVTQGQQARALRGVEEGSQTVATKPTITIDGNFSDWISSERIDFGDVTGYSLYSDAQNGFLYFDLNAPTGVAIGPTTTIWLNTDLNAATGYQIFGFAGGAEYNVEIKRRRHRLTLSDRRRLPRPSFSTTSRSRIRPTRPK